MQNKILNLPAAYIATNSLATVQAGGNLLNSTVTTLAAGGVGFVGTQPYIILKHIRINNHLSTAAVSVTLYKGGTLASVAGTEFGFTTVSVAAGSFVDWYGQQRFDTADYITGYASLVNAAVINMEGEIGLS